MQERIDVVERSGRTVVVKARPTASSAALRTEYEVLRRLRHPSVVQCVGWHEHDDHVELETLYAGPGSLADLEPVALTAAIDLSATVASIVGDLHGSGIAHGALTADHILVDADLRPVVCSFARSTSIDPERARADVAEAGDALRSLAQRVIAAAPLDRRGRRIAQQWVDTLDRMVAGQLTAAAAAGELSAHSRTAGSAMTGHRQTASPAGVGAAMATGTRNWRGRVGAPPGPTDPRGRLPRAVGALAVVGLALLTGWFGAGVVANSASDVEIEVASSADIGPGGAVLGHVFAMSATSSSAGSTDTCMRTVAPVDCLLHCQSGVDATGDGCGDDVAVDGNLLRVGGSWFRLGDPADSIVVGDWDCDGTATPALLRVATGEVFVFDRWPVDAPIEQLAAGRVVGATGLRLLADGPCDLLEVMRDNAGPTVLEGV